MIHFVASARQALQPFWGYFLVVETQKGEPGVRYQNTVLGEILKVIPRRVFGSIVSQHQGDRYGKDFHSWDHLVTLLYGQLGGVSSLRELVELWNVQTPHHYHLGTGPVCRSTFSDANQRRPSAIFADLFAHLTDLASRSLRHDGKQVLRLIDATPIPLASMHEWASWNGRTRGLKAHVVYDPNLDRPVHLEITSSTVNDVMIARDLSIERGAIYVFDKAYVDYHWWHRLHNARCIFITRPKTNVPFTVIKKRRLSKSARDASIFSDAIVRLASQQKTSLPINLRRIELRRDDGRVLTNPHQRSQTLRRQNRRSLSKALADRAVVPMDQAASENPRLLRPIRKRRPPADLRSLDCLPAAAHRRCRKPIQNFGPPLCRSRSIPALRAQPDRPHRQATAAKIPFHKAFAQPNGLRLCLVFTGQPCAFAGMTIERFGDPI